MLQPCHTPWLSNNIIKTHTHICKTWLISIITSISMPDVFLPSWWAACNIDKTSEAWNIIRQLSVIFWSNSTLVSLKKNKLYYKCGNETCWRTECLNVNWPCTGTLLAVSVTHNAVLELTKDSQNFEKSQVRSNSPTLSLERKILLKLFTVSYHVLYYHMSSCHYVSSNGACSKSANFYDITWYNTALATAWLEFYGTRIGNGIIPGNECTLLALLTPLKTYSCITLT